MPTRIAFYLCLLTTIPPSTADAQGLSGEPVHYVLPMPPHPAFADYEYGQIFLRVTPDENGITTQPQLVGIELMAADTVAFHFIDPTIFEEGVDQLGRDASADEKILLLDALVAARGTGLTMREGDLRRSRGERCPHCPDTLEPEAGPDSERPVVITVRLVRE